MSGSKCVGLLIILGWAVPATAASLTARVASVEVPSGGSVEVAVELSGGVGLGCMEGMLRFDPSVLRVEEVNLGALLEGALARHSSEIEGRVPFTFATTTSVKGEGTLLKVRFRAVGDAGKSSPLTLEGVRAWDDSTTQKELFLAVEAGKATVVASFPWLWIVCGLGGLLVVGAGLLRARRRPPSPAHSKASAATCRKCGAALRSAAKFCDACGAPRG